MAGLSLHRGADGDSLSRLTFSILEPLKSAFSKQTSLRLLVKERRASHRRAPLKSAPLRLVLIKKEPLKSAPCKEAPLKSALRRNTNLKLAQLRFAPLRSTLHRILYCRSARLPPFSLRSHIPCSLKISRNSSAVGFDSSASTLFPLSHNSLPDCTAAPSPASSARPPDSREIPPRFDSRLTLVYLPARPLAGSIGSSGRVLKPEPRILYGKTTQSNRRNRRT